MRFPKGSTGPDIPAVDTIAGMDVLAGGSGAAVLILPVGVMARAGLDVAERLDRQGIGATVVDPRWIKPLNPALPRLMAGYRAVVTPDSPAPWTRGR